DRGSAVPDPRGLNTRQRTTRGPGDRHRMNACRIPQGTHQARRRGRTHAGAARATRVCPSGSPRAAANTLYPIATSGTQQMGSVDSAVSLTKDRLEQGIFDWDVTKGDLDDITGAVNDLSPQERNEFISKLSDDDIKNWTQEIDGLNGSLSASERADVFNKLAEGMDATQMARFVKAFDGSPGGRSALADAVASHGNVEARVGFIEATKGSIDGDYSATQGNWGNAETAAIGRILASLEGDPAAFEQAVGSLSQEQLQDVMA